jgi:MFS family permease
MWNLNKNVIAIGWVSFFTDMASAMLVPVIPIFVVTVLNDGADKLGIIIAASSFLSYFLRFFAGLLAEKYRLVKPLLVAGYFISAICKPLFFWSVSWQSVAVLRSTERLGKAIRTAPKDLLIGHYSEKNRSGRNFGYHKMMDISGEMIGILLVSILFYFYASDENLIRNLFLTTAIPGGVAVVIMLFCVDDIEYVSNPKKETEKSSKPLTQHDRALLIPIVFFFLFTFFMFEESFLVLHSLEVGFELAIIPLLILANRFVQALISYQVGLLIDQNHSQRMLSWSYLFGLISLLCFLWGDPLMSWLGFVLYGVYSVVTLNILRAFISEKADRKGAMFGILYAGMAIVIALSALFFGFVWEHYGSQVGLSIAVLGCLLLCLGNILKRHFSAS